MIAAFPEIRMGNPLRYEQLSVFPLFTQTSSPVEYILSDEAIGNSSISVEEISESGSVPELIVENRGDVLVLFLEGEELVGAKQNRILNTSILVAAHTTTKLPVSCVEQGRWRYRSATFECSGSHSPSKLRRTLKRSVTRSLKARQGHRSDQQEIWREVHRQQEALEAASGTVAMSDTFESYRDRLTEFQDKLQYVDGAAGLAIAIGNEVVSVDLFDKPATCSKVWRRLLSGVVLDALETKPSGKQAEVADVGQVLAALDDLPWEPVDPAGEGEEYRADSDTGNHASALTFDDALVHGTVVCG